MNITISRDIKDKTPNFAIGVLLFDATIHKIPKFDQLIEDLEQEIRQEYTLKTLLQTPKILDARNAYKVYGKDPSRYRLAVESLFRRIIKGNTLYRINNLVDIGNYVSLQLKKSTAVLDADKINGDIFIRLGKDEPYEGIARGNINVEDIPVYVDNIGPFGSTTSDTPRTMITNQTSKVLVFIISFTGESELINDIEIVKTVYKKFANASNVSSWIAT